MNNLDMILADFEGDIALFLSEELGVFLQSIKRIASGLKIKHAKAINQILGDFSIAFQKHDFDSFIQSLNKLLQYFETIDVDKKNLLMHAIFRQEDHLAQRLIELLPLFLDNFDIDYEDANGLSALSYAVLEKNNLLVELLLTQGANPNGKIVEGSRGSYYKNKTSPLHLAFYNLFSNSCVKENIEIIKTILRSKEVNVNIENEMGDTPLYLAMLFGEKTLIDELLLLGAHITPKIQEWIAANERALEERVALHHIFMQGRMHSHIEYSERRSLITVPPRRRVQHLSLHEDVVNESVTANEAITKTEELKVAEKENTKSSYDTTSRLLEEFSLYQSSQPQEIESDAEAQTLGDLDNVDQTSQEEFELPCLFEKDSSNNDFDFEKHIQALSKENKSGNNNQFLGASFFTDTTAQPNPPDTVSMRHANEYLEQGYHSRNSRVRVYSKL